MEPCIYHKKNRRKIKLSSEGHQPALLVTVMFLPGVPEIIYNCHCDKVALLTLYRGNLLSATSQICSMVISNFLSFLMFNKSFI